MALGLGAMVIMSLYDFAEQGMGPGIGLRDDYLSAHVWPQASPPSGMRVSATRRA